jgi:hypothetical protein
LIIVWWALAGGAAGRRRRADEDRINFLIVGTWRGYRWLQERVGEAASTRISRWGTSTSTL